LYFSLSFFQHRTLITTLELQQYLACRTRCAFRPPDGAIFTVLIAAEAVRPYALFIILSTLLHHQNFIICSLSHYPPFLKISSVHNFLSYFADKQTNRPTPAKT